MLKNNIIVNVNFVLFFDGCAFAFAICVSFGL